MIESNSKNANPAETAPMIISYFLINCRTWSLQPMVLIYGVNSSMVFVLSRHCVSFVIAPLLLLQQLVPHLDDGAAVVGGAGVVAFERVVSVGVTISTGFEVTFPDVGSTVVMAELTVLLAAVGVVLGFDVAFSVLDGAVVVAIVELGGR